MKMERDTLAKLVHVQLARIASKDSSIKDQSKAVSSAIAIINAVTKDRDIVKRQYDLQTLDTKYFERLYRREKRKTGAIGLLGLAGIVTAILLK